MKKRFNTSQIYLIILILLYLFLTIWILKPAFQDDAFITFIYAKNFVKGKGLVYNSGEYIEGFSSPLYTLLIAFLSFVPFIDIPTASLVLSVISGILAIIILYNILKAYFPGRNFSIFLCLLVLISFSPFLVETMQGMETVFYIFLLTAFIRNETWKRETKAYLILYPCIILTRPEGFFLLLGYLSYRCFFDRKNLHRMIFITGFFLLTVCARYLYYGDIFPNTFYAKTPFSFGLLRQGIASNLIFFRKIIPLLLIMISFVMFNFRKLMKNSFIVIYPALFYVFFTSYIGGGFKFTHRYDIFAIPSYIILFSLALLNLSLYIKKEHFRLIFIILFILSAITYQHHSFQRAVGFHNSRKTIIERQTAFALYLKENYTENTVISTGQAGAIKYFTNFTNIDMLGLCDRHIAKGKFDTRGLNLTGHLKGDGEYVLSRDPDIIIFHNGLFSTKPLKAEEVKDRTLSMERFSGWLSEAEIMQNDYFWEKYSYKSIRFPDFYANYWEKRDQPESIGISSPVRALK